MAVTRDAQTASSLPTLDSGLRCPVCEYNLTGVAENRCPECGKAFDRDQLLATLAAASAPIPIWDDHSRNIVWRFTYMCLLAWFQPIRLSRMLPKNHSAASATKFRWLALAASMLPAWAAAAIGADLREGLAVIAVYSLPALVGIEITEAMLAIVLGDMALSQSLAGGRKQPATITWWRGFLGLLRSFVLVELAAIALTVWLVPRVGTNWVAVIVAIPYLWWWVSVFAVLLAQPISNSEKLTAIVIAPLFVGLAVIVAGLVGYVEAEIVSDVAWSLR